MIPRNRIWEEMKQAKANIVCLQRYTDKRRTALRWYNALMITISSGGALTSLIDKWYAVGATILIAVMSLLKAALPNLVQTEEELSELDRLLDYYNQYLNKLEKLWYEYDKDIISEDEMMNKLFAYKDEECNKMSVLNKGIRSLTKKEQDKIDKECGEYIDRVYFIKKDENE